MTRWQEERAELRARVVELWPFRSIREIAQELDVTASSVEGMARRAGLAMRPIAEVPGSPSSPEVYAIRGSAAAVGARR